MTAISHAMILSAGLGKRMRPLTDDKPKPLIEVKGKPLLDYTLGALADHGVGTAVVNHHYRGQQIVDHVTARTGPPRVVLSDETDLLLDTGGGLAKALPLLGADPFLVVNGDSILVEEGDTSISRLGAAWDGDRMDFLLLLVPMDRATGFDGTGDFDLDDEGRLDPKGNRDNAAFAYTGMQLVHPRAIADAPDGPFSMWVFWNRAIEAGRFFGTVHAGHWLHVGTPQGRDDAESFLMHR